METIIVNGKKLTYNKILYIDINNGNNNTGDGTKEKPLKTFDPNDYRGVLKEGDAVFFYNGVYNYDSIGNFFSLYGVEYIGEDSYNTKWSIGRSHNYSSYKFKNKFIRIYFSYVPSSPNIEFMVKLYSMHHPSTNPSPGNHILIGCEYCLFTSNNNHKKDPQIPFFNFQSSANNLEVFHEKYSYFKNCNIMVPNPIVRSDISHKMKDDNINRLIIDSCVTVHHGFVVARRLSLFSYEKSLTNAIIEGNIKENISMTANSKWIGSDGDIEFIGIYGFKEYLFVIRKSDQYFFLNDKKEWTRIDNFSLDKIIEFGNNFNMILDNIEILKELNENFEMLISSVFNSSKINLKGTIIPQVIIQNKDIKINNLKNINNIDLNVNGNENHIKVLFSLDKGESWLYYNKGFFRRTKGSNFSNSGMNLEELKSISKEEWNSLSYNKTIRFAFQLIPDENITNPEINQIIVNYNTTEPLISQAPNTDYAYNYLDNQTLAISLFNNGDFKVNYHHPTKPNNETGEENDLWDEFSL